MEADYRYLETDLELFFIFSMWLFWW